MFNCATSNLLCAKDNIFDDADYDAGAEVFETVWHHRNHRSCNQDKSFNGEELFLGFPVQGIECLAMVLVLVWGFDGYKSVSCIYMCVWISLL